MAALLYPGMIGGTPSPTPPPASGAAFGGTATDGTAAPVPVVEAPAAAPPPAPAAPPSAAQFGGTATGTTTPAPTVAPVAPPATPAPSNTGMIGAPAPVAPVAPAVAPVAPTGNWQQEVSGLNWAGGEGARSTANLWAIKNKYNLTDDQLATAIKGTDGAPLWTGAQVAQHFQRFGYGTTGPSPGVTGERQPDGRITDSPMDASHETIQGRMSERLARDAQGRYTHPAVRQAVDRQEQLFNARGLRNSSMAAQAGQEAAIAKAIEIVGPDAERYFQNRQNNVQAGNQFALKNQDIQGQKDLSGQQFQQNLQLKDKDFGNNEAERVYKLRTDYIGANDRALARYTETVNNINASQMTPADKTVAIQQANAVRDADLTYVNNLFSAQPGWQREWLAVAVPAGDMPLEQINNIDMLANIANDPAQPFERRAAAKARMNTLLAAAPAPTQAPTSGSGLINAGLDEGNRY